MGVSKGGRDGSLYRNFPTGYKSRRGRVFLIKYISLCCSGREKNKEKKKQETSNSSSSSNSGGGGWIRTRRRKRRKKRKTEGSEKPVLARY